MARINWIALVGVGMTSVVASQTLMWLTGWNHWFCIALGSLSGLCWPSIVRRDA